MPEDYANPKLSRRHKGHAIEQVAASWLSERGLTLVERNFTTKGGEIDLIMWQDDVLVFVEVRYRANTEHGSGAESITHSKIRKLLRTAEFYLQKNFGNTPPFCRFDVLSGQSEPIEFEWIKNAFA